MKMTIIAVFKRDSNIVIAKKKDWLSISSSIFEWIFALQPAIMHHDRIIRIYKRQSLLEGKNIWTIFFKVVL